MKKPKKKTAYDRFVAYIRKYESDTFSAVRSRITPREARKVADRLIDTFMSERLDGVQITGALFDVRDDE